MHSLVSIGTVGASPQIGEILPMTFFDCPVLSCPYLFSRSYGQVVPLGRFSRRVSAQGWSFWGLEPWLTIFGENMPPKLPKNGPE